MKSFCISIAEEYTKQTYYKKKIFSILFLANFLFARHPQASVKIFFSNYCNRMKKLVLHN